MTYSPQPQNVGSTLVGTRDQIRTNFEIIRDDFAINHVGYDETGEGKHKFMQMPEQASAPTTAANEGALYTKEMDSETNLFFRKESDGTEVQLTTSQTPTVGTDGATFLPGGLLMQWGFVNAPGASGQVTFTETYSAAPYSIQVSLYRNSGNQSVTVSSSTVPTTTTFNYLSSSAGSDGLYWIAIGPA